MLRWLVGPLLFLIAALLPATVRAQPAPDRSAPDRIVAVGDLHGDHAAWLAIARAAGLIDDRGRWSGGRTTLVQMGDIVDRGPDSLRIIRDLMRLEREAAAKGGRVVVLVGNHEAMMMLGDHRYVHPGEYAAFADRRSLMRRARTYELNRTAIEAAYRTRDATLSSDAIRAAWLATYPLGKIEHLAAWSPAGELGAWTIGHQAVVRLGSSLFVHGGLSAGYATTPLDTINRRVAEALRAQDQSPTVIISDPMGPLWYRGLVTRALDTPLGAPPDAPPAPPVAPTPRPTIEQELALVLRGQGVKRIVVGHTPTLGGIVEGLGGRLWRVDSAISSAYGGTPSYLEIIGDRVVAHKVARGKGTP